MTNPDYRAMCAELLLFSEEAGEICMNESLWPKSDPNCTLLDRARALLDQPVAEGPTDDELLRLVPQTLDDSLYGASRAMFQNSLSSASDIYKALINQELRFARAVLDKWGHQ